MRHALPVVPQVVLAAKRFATNVTRKWSFVCVCSLVNAQVVRLGEAASAVATRIETLHPVTRDGGTIVDGKADTISYSNPSSLGLITQEWLKDVSFSLGCGVHDRLHFYPLCEKFYFPGIYTTYRSDQQMLVSHLKDTCNVG